MECEFCMADLKDGNAGKCIRCGFPIQGTDQEKENFRIVNKELEQLIQEADSALSWARFGMLWPWLSSIVIGLCYFLRAPVDIYACAADIGLSSLFISCYFTVRKKPLPTLHGAFFALLMLTIFALYQSYEFSFRLAFWTPYIIPAILLIMFGNALYLMRKLEKRWKEKKEFSN